MSPSALHAGSASFGNENSHPSPEPELGNAARWPCVCARGCDGGGPGRRRQGSRPTLGISSLSPLHTDTLQPSLYKVERRLCAWPWVLILALGQGDAWSQGPGSGCWLFELGPGWRAPVRAWTRARRGPEVRGPWLRCPCAPRSGLPGRRSRDAGCRERGRGKRAGGRQPGEECGCVCGREGRPAASCFLSVSA